MKYGWVAALGACLALYANSFNNGFHYDDEHSIQQNIYIRTLANVPAFFTDPAMFSVDADKGMYRPLLLLSYALNYALTSGAGWRATTSASTAFSTSCCTPPAPVLYGG